MKLEKWNFNALTMLFFLSLFLFKATWAEQNLTRDKLMKEWEAAQGEKK